MRGLTPDYRSATEPSSRRAPPIRSEFVRVFGDTFFIEFDADSGHFGYLQPTRFQLGDLLDNITVRSVLFVEVLLDLVVRNARAELDVRCRRYGTRRHGVRDNALMMSLCDGANLLAVCEAAGNSDIGSDVMYTCRLDVLAELPDCEVALSCCHRDPRLLRNLAKGKYRVGRDRIFEEIGPKLL